MQDYTFLLGAIALAVPSIVQQIKEKVRPEHVPYLVLGLAVAFTLAGKYIAAPELSILEALIGGLLSGIAGTGGYELIKPMTRKRAGDAIPDVKEAREAKAAARRKYA